MKHVSLDFGIGSDTIKKVVTRKGHDKRVSTLCGNRVNEDQIDNVNCDCPSCIRRLKRLEEIEKSSK